MSIFKAEEDLYKIEPVTFYCMCMRQGIYTTAVKLKFTLQT